MESHDEPEIQQPLSITKIFLIVSLVTLAFLAIGLTVYFSVGPAKLTRSQKLVKCFFGPDPVPMDREKENIPLSEDITEEDWFELMQYYNTQVQKSLEKFHPSDVSDFEKMKRLVVRETGPDSIEIHIFYLEALYRSQKYEAYALLMDIIMRKQSITLPSSGRLGAPVSILNIVADRLQMSDIEAALTDAIKNPCIEDEELFFILVSDAEVLQDLSTLALDFRRFRLLDYINTSYLGTVKTKQEKMEFCLKMWRELTKKVKQSLLTQDDLKSINFRLFDSYLGNSLEALVEAYNLALDEHNEVSYLFTICDQCEAFLKRNSLM